MMTIETIADIINVSMPVGLIVVLVWWLLAEGWPYWKQRDTASREQTALDAERDHERELAQTASANLQAEALTVLASAIQTCPLKTVDT